MIGLLATSFQCGPMGMLSCCHLFSAGKSAGKSIQIWNQASVYGGVVCDPGEIMKLSIELIVKVAFLRNQIFKVGTLKVPPHFVRSRPKFIVEGYHQMGYAVCIIT